MEYIYNNGNISVVLKVIEAIHQNAAYLSEIDGATGDGDHGINMDKGFLLAKERINSNMTLSEGFEILGTTLITDIGGSMGPLYGTFFLQLFKVMKDVEQITPSLLFYALESSRTKLMDLAGAKFGDKTLLDTLGPAQEAYKHALDQQQPFYDMLEALISGAEEGKENTKNLVAKIGRAARLGERSRGFLDAGAVSCCIILTAMAMELQRKIVNSPMP